MREGAWDLVEFSSRDDLEKWLQGQPKQVSVVIAARSALWALPALGSLPDISRKQSADIFLPIFRAIALPWVVSRYPSYGNLINIAAITIGSAADAAADATNTVSPAFPTFAHAAAKAATAAAASTIVGNFVSAAAITAACSVTATSSTSVYAAIAEEASLLEEGSMTVQLTSRQPLWPDGLPNGLQGSWYRLKSTLLSFNENWQVWTDWYEDRLYGREPNKELELARATIDEEIWEQGPAVVNAHIKELIEEFKPPEAPTQGRGPAFSIQNGQLIHAPALPDSEEAEDHTQQKLFKRLRMRIQRLSAFSERMGNQHPGLFESVSDYQDELNVGGVGEIDVTTLWMTGASLMEHARAYRSFDPDAAMTPALEPETDAILQECSRLHGAFIMGFEEGQELISKSELPHLSRDELEQLVDNEREIVQAVLDLADEQVDSSARQVFAKFQHGLDSMYLKLETKAEIGFPVVRNVLIGIGTYSRAAVIGAAGLAGLGVAPDMAVHWITFLQSMSAPIMGFANNSPELREYLLWLYDRLEESRDKDE